MYDDKSSTKKFEALLIRLIEIIFEVGKISYKKCLMEDQLTTIVTDRNHYTLYTSAFKSGFDTFRKLMDQSQLQSFPKQNLFCCPSSLIEEDLNQPLIRTKSRNLQNVLVFRMRNSNRLARKSSYEVAKHQSRYMEFLESLSKDLGVSRLRKEFLVKQTKQASRFRRVPEFLAQRLKKTIQRVKQSVYSLFYDIPLHINMKQFRRNVQEQHRMQILLICELIQILDVDKIFKRLTQSVEWIKNLKVVFNPVNEEFLSAYQFIVKVQIQIEQLLLQFFTIKQFCIRKPTWKGEDSDLLKDIENDFTKKTFYYVIKQYLDGEGEQLQHTICRICEESIRIQQLQDHITICQKQHQKMQILKSAEKDLISILEEIKSKGDPSIPLHGYIIKTLEVFVLNGQIYLDIIKGKLFEQLKVILRHVSEEQSDSLLAKLKSPLKLLLEQASASGQNDFYLESPYIFIVPPPITPTTPVSPAFSIAMQAYEFQNQNLINEFVDTNEIKCQSDCGHNNSGQYLGAVESVDQHRNLSQNALRESTDVSSSTRSVPHIEKKIGFKDFKVIRFLGKGAFGKVYLVQRRLTKDFYAMKTIELNKDFNKEKLQDLMNEHEIFKKIGGQHLVKASFSFTQGGVHFFFLEFMQGGDLAELLEKQVYFSQDVAKYYVAEIALAVEHLHSFGIVHRDLKPNNIVIDKSGHLRLTDFGLSTFGEIEANNLGYSRAVGTPDYMAPQMLKQEEFNIFTADWWSLGVIIYQLLIGAKPFGGQTVEQVFDNIRAGVAKIEWPDIGEEEGMITLEAKDIIEKFLEADPSKRLGSNGIELIKQHPFFKGLKWQSVKNDESKFQQEERPKIKTDENFPLTKQIEKLIKKPIQSSLFKAPDDLVRFDILSEETIKYSQKVKRKNSVRLTKINELSKNFEKHFA